MKHVEKEKTVLEEPTQKKNNTRKIIILVGIGITVIISGLLLYSRYIATTGLIVKEYKITNSNIPARMHGLKIVHISDIHYGRITYEKQLKNLVKKINLTKPDLVILSGDLIDKDTKVTGEMADQISSILKEIDASVGKYAIKGNHDYHLSQWDFILENSGFIDLDDTYDTIYKKSNDYILLTGMSTNLYGSQTIDEKLASTNQFLESLTEESIKPSYKILVLHEPDYMDQIDINEFDLILAGHSHNGQVNLPFIGPIWLPKGAKTYYKPHYKINQTEIFISSGIGVSKVNFRLFNRPSFNLYRLTTY